MKICSATKRLGRWLNQNRDGHHLEYLLRGVRVRDVVPRRTANRSSNARRLFGGSFAEKGQELTRSLPLTVRKADAIRESRIVIERFAVADNESGIREREFLTQRTRRNTKAH